MKALLRRLFQSPIALITQVRGWVSALRLFVDPSQLERVFEMDRDLSQESIQKRVALLRQDETARRALDDRRRLVIEPATLARLEEGTLGREVAEFLRKNGLDPKNIPTLPAESDEEYFSAHLYETHDLWHVVTGFSTDVAGEIGLQAVYAAKFQGKLAMLIVGGGLLQAAVRAPHDFGRRVDAIVRGWRIGRQARTLFGVDWATLWGVPLADVRRELGIS
jgi:ubiquinone biosynthesis protein Coq4